MNWDDLISEGEAGLARAAREMEKLRARIAELEAALKGDAEFLEKMGSQIARAHDLATQQNARIAELEKEGTGFVVERATFRTKIAQLEAEVAELKLHACELTEVLENRNGTIAELEELGNAMADELESIAGVGDVCGLCHVYSSRHKGNCSAHDIDAWRKARAASTEAK